MNKKYFIDFLKESSSPELYHITYLKRIPKILKDKFLISPRTKNAAPRFISFSEFPIYGHTTWEDWAFLVFDRSKTHDLIKIQYNKNWFEKHIDIMDYIITTPYGSYDTDRKIKIAIGYKDEREWENPDKRYRFHISDIKRIIVPIHHLEKAQYQINDKNGFDIPVMPIGSLRKNKRSNKRNSIFRPPENKAERRKAIKLSRQQAKHPFDWNELKDKN